MAYFIISILLSFFLIAQFGSSQTFPSCITNYTVTGNDPFKSNLLTLFTALKISSSTLGSLTSFDNTTAGESPNEAYGLYQCRADASDTCQSCVTTLTASLSDTQSGCKEGAAFMDGCMVHYANYSFFGTPDDRILEAQLDKGTPSKEYKQAAEVVLQEVIDIVNSHSSKQAGVGALNYSEPVYALALCTEDINISSCIGCLKTAQAYLQANITGVAKSAWAMLPSCQLRYDNASFDETEASPASFNTAPSTAVLLATLVLFLVNWLF